MHQGLIALVAMAALAGTTHAQVSQGPKNVPEFEPAFENQTRAPEIRNAQRFNVEVIADGLAHPWGIEVLPDGAYLVTERPGGIKVIRRGEGVQAVAGAPEVLARGQGGLLDIALAEDFESSRRIYLAYAKPLGSGRSATAAASAVLQENPPRLTDLDDLFVQTPPSTSSKHFGSRIVPHDGHVFVTTGERSSRRARILAQDLKTTYGKVVRVTPGGGIPDDNPFLGQGGALGEVWSYGHRNPQGAAIHPRTGELWTLEHGPAGGDELNLIKRGANYGWPLVSYGENYIGTPVGTGKPRAEGITEPRYYWDPVIAPGGFVFYDGDMFDWNGDIVAGSLNPGGIVRLRLRGVRVSGEARYLEELGRIRDVEVDRDGAILLLVDARDGALIRVTPAS
ncbi:MAG: PQQ-dependent sugar dehydrogenase [Boseongicola sp. SB0664_bin_43]|uniref:PQQ-dependent sugar dehydrogenase n=1 Tax=Boseongicola sp. SB0664_bin_43 TaxID=2604844 RepID=A0A6B0Y0V1_9RHOB|nr:PQQ-dependent sugar dehydrogenase [Boseongicola sp. SB0664_bin_43]